MELYRTNFNSNCGFPPHPASRWAILAAWALRSLLVATAIAHLVQGAFLYALFCLFLIGLLVAPPLLARSSLANLPIEVELVALWWAATDMTLGRLANLYETSLWFDKALHFSNSILLGLLGFLIVYGLYFTGRLRTSLWINGIIIFLLTLGLGAFWEIVEYFADLVFHKGAQGSPLQAPLDDTMWDLVLDGIGGALGAFLGTLYMQFSKRSHCRIAAFANLVTGVSTRMEKNPN